MENGEWRIFTHYPLYTIHYSLKKAVFDLKLSQKRLLY
jgi:hypothetical protein